jgi:hypothetical protein
MNRGSPINLKPFSPGDQLPMTIRLTFDINVPVGTTPEEFQRSWSSQQATRKLADWIEAQMVCAVTRATVQRETEVVQ